MSDPTFPALSEHVAIAGRTGTGKTWGAMDMLEQRLFLRGQPFPWLVIDSKRDSTLKKMNAVFEPLDVKSKFLPDKGVHIIRPKINGEDRGALEDLLVRAFKKKKMGVYVDEGHLLGKSPALRMFLVAGRSQNSPVMWTSQRASDIDTFIWSQSTYFRCFALHGPNDHKRFHENYGFKYLEPERFHSWYYDGNQGQTFQLGPSRPIDEVLEGFKAKLLKRFVHI